jgi:mannose-6-phosphate isomerase-like protein (cupin superfamily)
MKLDYDISDYIEKIKTENSYFNTFINTENLAAGVLVLQPGEKDTQEPHDNDEVYYIIKGDGFLKIKNKDYLIEKNKIYFVKQKTEHFFHDNTKELVALYFFGGPDS